MNLLNKIKTNDQFIKVEAIVMDLVMMAEKQKKQLTSVLLLLLIFPDIISEEWGTECLGYGPPSCRRDPAACPPLT